MKKRVALSKVNMTFFLAFILKRPDHTDSVIIYWFASNTNIIKFGKIAGKTRTSQSDNILKKEINTRKI